MRRIFTRARDGASVTEDEALDATGTLKEGYWIHNLSPLMNDGASGGQSRVFMHDGQDKLTLSDSDRAYYEMIERDQNAWRNPDAQPCIRQADSAQPAPVVDSATAWAKMVANDQNAWRAAHKGASR